MLGGSVAGLLAARVLADAYENVTIVERDRLPTDPAQRRGVPQGRHAHGILPSGLAVMERLRGCPRCPGTGGCRRFVGRKTFMVCCSSETLVLYNPRQV